MFWHEPGLGRVASSPWRRRMLMLLAGALATLGLLAAALLAALWWGQERLIFQPTPLPVGHHFRLPADVQEGFIDVPGARLNTLHLRLPRPDGAVFFLHGNAGNLTTWFVNADFYRALNVELFMLDYRGYGKSSGQVRSQAELLADVQAAWRTVAPGWQARPVVIYGRSLGSGLAAQLAARLPADHQPALLMLVSPYRSLQALAAQHYPWLPSGLLRYPLRTDLALQALHAQGASGPPVLLLHGEQDALIPIAHSEALAAANPGVALQRIAGAGHGDLQAMPAYLDAVRRAIRSAVAPKAPKPPGAL